MSSREKIIVALDVQNNENFVSLSENLRGHAIYVKVGMELFYTKGPEIISELKEMGFKIFLDLKLHDIPNTVYHATKTLTRLGVDILNVHASAGFEAMQAAVKGRNEGVKEFGIINPPLLIAVTQLTSSNQDTLKNDLLISERLEDVVNHYALRAKDAGFDGVVTSAHEVMAIKKICGKDFLTITPGIRLKNSESNDQKRVMTPREALDTGSDFIVIGRAITNSAHPAKELEAIIEELDK